MSIIDRKIRQKEEVRATILDTAWGLVVAEGWHSFSIRKIADAIEYSVPVIYSHFENKDAILLEFNRKGFALLAQAMAAAKAGQSNPADELRAMGRAYWKWALTNKEYYQLMFGLGMPTCDTARKIPAMQEFQAVIESSILAMAPAGKTCPFDPFLKYQSFWSMLHGLVSINMASVSTMTDKAGSQDGSSKDCYDGSHGKDGMPELVLEDVLCSFIRGVQAAVNSAGG